MNSKSASDTFSSLLDDVSLAAFKEDFKEMFTEFLVDESGIQALYMNLAMSQMRELPPELLNSINTVAGYFLGIDFDLRSAVAAWPTWDIEPGDVLTNTRMFSTPVDSAEIIRGETGANPSRQDRGSESCFYTAGAVFRVEKSKDSHDAALQRGIYLKQVDTYLEWELGQSKDGINMDPDSGHLSRHGEFFSLKDYLSGVPVNKPQDKEYGSARWYRPFDSPVSLKAIRDAVQAAILNGDPITWDLDKATQNIHHEYFRQQAIKQAKSDVQDILQVDWESNWEDHTRDDLSVEVLEKLQRAALIRTHEQNRVRQREDINRRARQLADRIAGFRPDQQVDIEEQKLFIWLLVNILRREIKLLDITDTLDGSGTEAKLICAVSRGYDKVDLAYRKVESGHDDTIFDDGR